MTREEQIMNDPDLQCYVDKKRGWINEAFKDGVDWADKELANASVIHWQTGEPPTNGVFLVVYKGEVCVFERKREFWIFHNIIISGKDIISWFKISDIKPPQQ